MIIIFLHHFQPEYTPNIFTASIPPLDTGHISAKCRRQDGAGRLRHHAADRYGPVTVQLIKPRRGDSSLTLGLCVPPTQPGGAGTQREGSFEGRWAAQLAPPSPAPGVTRPYKVVAVTWSVWRLLLAAAINKDPHLSNRDKLQSLPPVHSPDHPHPSTHPPVTLRCFL